MTTMRWPSILLLGAVASASAQTPHLSGRVTVDPSRGLLDGRLCLSRFAPRPDLRFVLSAALNLMVVSDSTGRSLLYDGEYNGRLIGEAREYVVPRREREPPSGNLCVAYRGAVPPFDTTQVGRLRSLAALQRVVAREPDRPAAQYQIGKIGALTGEELDAAQASLERYLRHPVVSGSPSHAAAYWRLGQIEEHRGRPDQARAAYRAALERDPAHAPAREALSRLGGAAPGLR